MANTVEIVVTGRDQNAKQTIEGVSESTDHAGRRFDNFMGAARRAAGALGLIVTAGKAMDLTFKAGFDRLLDLEDAEKRMTQMGLSTEQVDRLMGGLTDTVTGTSFKLNEGADIMTRFVASGMDLDDVNRRLEMTADTAAFAQAPLGEIGNIFERIQNEGRLTGESLRMLQVRGVPALELLASTAGVSGERMREMISQGLVDADSFFQLWEQGSQGFGDNMIRIEGSAKSMGDTTRGAIENAQTAFARLGAAVLEDFMPAIRNGFDQLRTEVDITIDRWNLLADTIGTAGDVFEFLTPDTDEAASGFGEWVGMAKDAAGGVIGAFMPVVHVWDMVRGGADEAAESTGFFADKSREVRGAAEGALERLIGLHGGMSDTGDATREANEALQAQIAHLGTLKDALFEASGGLLDLTQKEIAYEAQLEKVTEEIKANGAGLDLKTDKGRANQSALIDLTKSGQDLVQTMIDEGAAADEAGRKMEDLRADFIRNARQAGLTKTAAEELADSYGLIPSKVETQVELVDRTQAAIKRIRDDLATLRDRTVTITARANIPQGVSIRRLMDMERGGIVGGGMKSIGSAQGGGPRANRVLVGEAGPEVVDLPFGSRVIPTVDQAMDRNQAGTGGGPGEVRVVLELEGAEDAFVQAFRKALRVRGQTFGGAA